MVVSQARSKRTVTGSKYTAGNKKKQYEMGRRPSLTRIADRNLKTIRVLGGEKKTRVITDTTANVLDEKTRKYVKAKIISVVENPANRHYTRRNIITKGTVIETDKGNAKVTSRPGQDGTINAVLVKK